MPILPVHVVFFLNLCILSFLSRFGSLYARFIFKTHLMLKFTHGRVFFSACSSWINILTSYTWVCNDGIPHWLHLFPLFKHLLCQPRGSLWAENKSRESSFHCSGICECLYSLLPDSWVRLHQSPREDGWRNETLRSPRSSIPWAIFHNMTANQAQTKLWASRTKQTKSP